MTNTAHSPTALLSCTAFDRGRQIASGPYLGVAFALKAYDGAHPGASLLVFDDATGKQIDFDLRGSDAEITARLQKPRPAAEVHVPRTPGRPKLGVVAREITLLPRHWDWLAEQPGGASVTLRRLVEEARRRGPTSKAMLRVLQERSYSFMSAMAGNFPNFEEASRALFANDIQRLKELIAAWPKDVRDYLLRLCSDDRHVTQAK